MQGLGHWAACGWNRAPGPSHTLGTLGDGIWRRRVSFSVCRSLLFIKCRSLLQTLWYNKAQNASVASDFLHDTDILKERILPGLGLNYGFLFLKLLTTEPDVGDAGPGANGRRRTVLSFLVAWISDMRVLGLIVYLL